MSALKKSIAAAASTLALAGATAQEIDQVKLSPDITLRRMIVKNPAAKGTVLLLHGFPETILTWRDLALDLD